MNRRATDRRTRREDVAAKQEATVATPEELLARVRLERRIVELVTELDEPFRATILLRYHEALSAAEIARRAGVPDATVRWRVARGLERLRAGLDEDAGGARADWRLALVPLIGTPRSTAVVTVAKGAFVSAKIFRFAGIVGALTLGTAIYVTNADEPSAESKDVKASLAEDMKPAPSRDGDAAIAPEHDLASASDRKREGVRLPPLDPSARESMLSALSQARTARQSARATSPGAPAGGGPTPPPPTLDREYIRAQMADLSDVFNECYASALADSPDLAGKLIVTFTISGEPDVGGLVEYSEVDPAESTLHDLALTECVVESVYTLQFPPPPEGGHVVVRYPITFAPGKDHG